MALHAAPLPGEPRIQAVMYGPLVLAGRLGIEGLNEATLRVGPTAPRTVPEFKLPPAPVPRIRASSTQPGSWLGPVSGHPLEFRTRAGHPPVTLVPLSRLFDGRYAVYWAVDPLPV